MITLSKNDKFPQPKDSIMGDMLILKQTNDLFVFDGKKWVMVGGQYLPKHTREKVFNYFKDGWEYSDILKYDMLNYLDTSEFFERIFYKRIVDLANNIVPEELNE